MDSVRDPKEFHRSYVVSSVMTTHDHKLGDDCVWHRAHDMHAMQIGSENNMKNKIANIT